MHYPGQWNKSSTEDKRRQQMSDVATIISFLAAYLFVSWLYWRFKRVESSDVFFAALTIPGALVVGCIVIFLYEIRCGFLDTTSKRDWS
jgi:hypothetical protein